MPWITLERAGPQGPHGGEQASSQKIRCDLCSWETENAYWGPKKARAGAGVWWPKEEEHQGEDEPAWSRGALHAKASGRARAIAPRASTSRLSCQSIGGRRLVANGSVALLARSRKHIQAASRRRHPRQAHHRLRCRHLRGTPSRKDIQAASLRRHPAYHLLRPKKGSQPWRRRWLSFESELPSWRSTSGARPPGSLRVHRHDV